MLIQCVLFSPLHMPHTHIQHLYIQFVLIWSVSFTGVSSLSLTCLQCIRNEPFSRLKIKKKWTEREREKVDQILFCSFRPLLFFSKRLMGAFNKANKWKCSCSLLIISEKFEIFSIYSIPHFGRRVGCKRKTILIPAMICGTQTKRIDW